MHARSVAGKYLNEMPGAAAFALTGMLPVERSIAASEVLYLLPSLAQEVTGEEEAQLCLLSEWLVGSNAGGYWSSLAWS